MDNDGSQPLKDRQETKVEKNTTKKPQYDGSEPLRSSRHEMYCQLKTCGVSEANAYEQAGYISNTPGQHARQLERNSLVKLRIRYLQSKMAEKLEITRKGQAEKFDRALTIATVQGNSTGMVAAITGTNRLFGLDKQVIEQAEQHRELSKTEQQEAREWAQFKLWQRNRGDRPHSCSTCEIDAHAGTQGPAA